MYLEGFLARLGFRINKLPQKTYSSVINISAFIYQMVHVSATLKALNKCL